MEWNKQLIEMAKIRSRPIFAWFYIGYRQKYDFCEPDVSRFKYFVSTGSTIKKLVLFLIVNNVLLLLGMAFKLW